MESRQPEILTANALVRFFVRQAFPDLDRSEHKAMLQSIEVRIEADFNRKHRTIHALIQAGEIGGQALWQHANSLGRQVDGRGALQRLCIQGISSRETNAEASAM